MSKSAMNSTTRKFETLQDAAGAGFIQEGMTGSRFRPLDCRVLGPEERNAFEAGYESSMVGGDCPVLAP